MASGRARRFNKYSKPRRYDGGPLHDSSVLAVTLPGSRLNAKNPRACEPSEFTAKPRSLGGCSAGSARLVVGVPSRDVLLVTTSVSTKGGVQMLRDAVKEAQTGDNTTGLPSIFRAAGR